MAGEQPAPIVPLIEEQAHRIALVETQFEFQAILAHDERLRSFLPHDVLRRRSNDAAGSSSWRQVTVICASRGVRFHQALQLIAQGLLRGRFTMRQKELCELLNVPARIAIACSVDDPVRISALGIDKSAAQSETRVRCEIGGSGKYDFPAIPGML